MCVTKVATKTRERFIYHSLVGSIQQRSVGAYYGRRCCCKVGGQGRARRAQRQRDDGRELSERRLKNGAKTNRSRRKRQDREKAGEAEAQRHRARSSDDGSVGARCE